MNPRTVGFGWMVLLLLFTHEQGRAEPLTSVQSWSKWLEEGPEPRQGGSEEMEPEKSFLAGAPDSDDGVAPWLRNAQEGAPLSESALQRLFGDVLGSSRRYKGRAKKGVSRGCFGVKLDRIGAFSGLGC
ncbi:C-type natriuretic peptide 1 [Pogona vitticeps]